MARDGSGVYSAPAGTTATSGTTIESAKYNAFVADLVADANNPRPIVAGGTGATTAAGILAATGVTASVAEVNTLDGITATTAELNILDGVTANAAELNILDGATLSTAELNFVDGVTSAIQTQLDGKISAITDPNADRILFWDDSAGAYAYLTAGTGLAISGTTLSATGADLFFRLDSDHAGANSTSLQNFFPQAVTLEASSVYEYEFWIGATKSAGTNAHTFSVGFGGTHTRNNTFRHLLTSGQNNVNPNATVLTFTGFSSAASDVVVSSYTSASATFWHREAGSFSVNGAGTWFPAYQLSAAPGGAWSTVAGSYVRLRKMGAAGSNSSQGTWA